MTEAGIEIVLQGAKEQYRKRCPGSSRTTGRSFNAKDFKEFVRISGMTHVRTSPFYPQSNEKVEHCTSPPKASASGGNAAVAR
jgi:putative transposase